jgi:hypothetical protein
MRRFPSLVAAVVVASVLSLATTGAAPAQSGEYCAVRIEPVGSTAEQAAPSCFDSQAEVDAYLAQVTGAHALSRAASTSVLIGTVYKDGNYGGGSYTFYGAGSCVGVTYGFASLDPSWQNTISSAKAYASCWVTLYDAPSYAGSRYNCTPNCASLPSFNDKTRSLVFRPAGTVG